MIVHERLEDIVRQLLGDDNVVLAEAENWTDVPGWDSLAHVNLVFSAEQAFGVQFTDEELDSVTSIADFEQLLVQKIADT